jgi:hypothetical protein
MHDPTPTPFDIRRGIAQAFDALPIFARSLETALYNYCAVMEVNSYIAGATNKAIYSANRETVEACTHALTAVLNKCQRGEEQDLRINEAAYGDARELFEFSKDFEQVKFCFELVDREQFSVAVEPGSHRLLFNYASSKESSADTMLRSSELVEHLGEPSSPEKTTTMMNAVHAVAAELHKVIKFVSTDGIEYSYSPFLISAVKEWAALLEQAHPWEFPETICLGALCFADLRKFWGALLAIVNTHELAHRIASQGAVQSWPIGSIVHMRSTNEWAELIATISGLSTATTSEILAWHIFDPRVMATTPSVQPFIEIRPGILIAPWTTVALSNIERNLQKILNRHPKLRNMAEGVKKQKEQIALASLSRLFPSSYFSIATQVIIPGITDADMIIYARQTGFVLVLQHKWIIDPDTAVESATNDDELSKGAVQAIQSRDWLRANEEFLRKALKLSATDPISQVEAVVVCRGGEPTAFLPKTATPVVTERAFEKLWQKANDLGQLWIALQTRPDHVEAANQFQDANRIIDLGGYQIVVPVLIG